MKIQKTNSPTSTTKAAFGVLAKGSDWQEASWAWVKKNSVKKSKFGYYAYRGLRITVRASLGNEWMKGLRQVWEIDEHKTDEASAPDLNERAKADETDADKYAKHLVENGEADSASVAYSAWGYSKHENGMSWINVHEYRYEKQD